MIEGMLFAIIKAKNSCIIGKKTTNLFGKKRRTILKKSIVFVFLSLLLLAGAGGVSQAAIIEGIYLGDGLNTSISMYSLVGPTFGVGDTSSGISNNTYLSWEDNIRTVQIPGVWVPNADGITAQRTMYSERIGSIKFSGKIFDNLDSDIYTASILSKGTGHNYYELISNTWEFDYFQGTYTGTGHFLEDPFSYTITGDILLDEWVDLGNQFAKIDGSLTNVRLIITADPVPEPATLLLLGFGLLGLAGVSRKKN
jgi:hypothetical protein